MGVVNIEYLTKNFTVEEMACKCGKCKAEMNPYFMIRVQMFRDEWGRPLYVRSGARCPVYNRVIGGKKGSRHISEPDLGIRARAVDFAVESSLERIDMIALAIKIGFWGIGHGSNFIHLDDRPYAIRRSWTY